jgi:prepilin-type N-terminal cleavage/methylation domain-containing protein
MDSRGFTLVELMIVVAIVGLLASIAIPNFQYMIGKARQAEAKGYLASIYETEQGFFGENNTFTYCLEEAGFEPDAQSQRYYMVGYKDSHTASGPPCPGVDCYDYAPGQSCKNATPFTCESASAWGNSERDDCTFGANQAINPGANLALLQGGWVPSPWDGEVFQNSFTALAIGSISSSGALDVWSIDQSNNLVYVNDGL